MRPTKVVDHPQCILRILPILRILSDKEVENQTREKPHAPEPILPENNWWLKPEKPKVHFPPTRFLLT